jgi:nicotinate dehydrogenase subunit A
MSPAHPPGGTALSVNGRACRSAAEGKVPLLYVLRNEFGLTACKFGCGEGQCGACTVIVNGRAVQSCNTPMWSLSDAEVLTLEGLGTADGALGEVQRAFEQHNAIQCGYCIPGILMTLHALKTQEPQASAERIRAELAERHLCRCGTHTRILAAAESFFGRTALSSP